jgi:hypothetical protein
MFLYAPQIHSVLLNVWSMMKNDMKGIFHVFTVDIKIVNKLLSIENNYLKSDWMLILNMGLFTSYANNLGCRGSEN